MRIAALKIGRASCSEMEVNERKNISSESTSVSGAPSGAEDLTTAIMSRYYEPNQFAFRCENPGYVLSGDFDPL